MQIKQSEGHTLLSFLRLGIVFIACLSVGNVQTWADATFAFFNNAETIIDEFLNEQPAAKQVEGDPFALYYRQPAESGKGMQYIYQQYYLTGSGDQHGLKDASGRELLPERYQGILVLPAAYFLNLGQGWQLFDRETLTPLSELTWDDVKVELSENGLLENDLIQVKKDGLYGAVNMQGQVVIEPIYEEFDLYSYDADWPLIRVKQDGLYGYIDSQGRVVIDLRYDYAVLGSITLHADENDAEGEVVPVIYVKLGEDWGGILKQGDQPAAVDWDIEPSQEALVSYDNTTSI